MCGIVLHECILYVGLGALDSMDSFGLGVAKFSLETAETARISIDPCGNAQTGTLVYFSIS